jgi:hypothetical protein
MGCGGGPARNEGGTTPVSVFCCRTAHDGNVLVRQTQSGLTRVSFQRRIKEQAWREVDGA